MAVRFHRSIRATPGPDAGPGSGTRERARGYPEREHRPIDGIRALLALAAVAVIIGSVQGLPLAAEEISTDVSRWFSHIPRWLAFGAAGVAGLGAFLLVAVAGAAVLRRNRQEALDAAVATVLAGAGAAGSTALWRTQHAVSHVVVYGNGSSVLVIAAAFCAFVVSADLLHRPGWGRWSAGCAAALLLSGVADGALPPFAAAVAAAGGPMVGWGVRWALGVPPTRPPDADLADWLAARDLVTVRLLASPRRIRNLVSGVLDDGTRIEVHFANRDTRGSGALRRIWALVRLRPAVAGQAATGSRARIQELALACALADRVGVTAPRLVLLESLPEDTLALVTTVPDGGPVEQPLTPAVAASLFESLASLHRAGITHRDLRPQNLLVRGDSTGFANLDSALPGAGPVSRHLDVAQLVTTVARLADPDAAVRALRVGYEGLDEAAVASVLQPVALAPWGWSAMRQASGCLAEVRARLVGSGQTVALAQLERFRWRTVVSAAALAIAGYVIAGQVASVNLLATLSRMSIWWFGLAVLASSVTYWAASANLSSFVSKRLSLLRGSAVQLATSFIGVAMPSTLGYVAVNARYLSRQDVDQRSVTAAVALTQVVNAATTVLMVVVLGLLTGSGVSRVKLVPGADVVTAALVVAGLLALLWLVPATRARLRRLVSGYLKGIVPQLLQALSRPLRLGAGVASSVLLNAAYVTAFLAALHSVGAHPPILATAVVYLIGGAVGAAAPTPGGLGGVEAALAAGLTGIGVPTHQAVPAVLIFRFATFWLPIPIGWISYMALQRTGTL